MSKRFEHTHSGFTLAEMLIVMLIFAFVVALSVPVLQPQKKKKPSRVLANHGIFECYYDSSGKLHEFTANNSDNKSGTDKIVSDACYFAAPTANYYTIQLIGAGGDGGLLGGVPHYTPANIYKDGQIGTFTSFKKDLEAAPEWVKEKWNSQWQYTAAQKPIYTVVSPVGSSGDSICSIQKNASQDCNACFVYNAGCPDYCITTRYANGGDSGYGAQYRAEIPVYADDDIQVSKKRDYTELRFSTSRYIRIPSSGNGQSATKINNILRNGADGANASTLQIHTVPDAVNGVISTNYNRKNEGAEGCNSYLSGGNSGATAILGSASVDSSTEKIPYRYQTLSANVLIGQSGSPGKVASKMYEKLPATSLKLVPAKTVSGASILYAKVDGVYKQLIKADSGVSSGSEYLNLAIESAQDFPFPSSYYPKNFEAQMPDLAQSFENLGFKSKIQEMQKKGLYPGSSGWGAYPVITNVSGTSKYWINNVYLGTETLSDIDFQSQLQDIKCLDGSDLKIKDGKYYCTSTKGQPGAITITW